MMYKFRYYTPVPSKPAVEEIIFHFFVFFRCYLPVQFRVFVGTAAGNVLVHEAEHHIAGLKGLRHPVNDAFRILQKSRQHQVADDDTTLHDAVCVQPVGADLPAG